MTDNSNKNLVLYKKFNLVNKSFAGSGGAFLFY